jgi:hypothetical protein
MNGLRRLGTLVSVLSLGLALSLGSMVSTPEMASAQNEAVEFCKTFQESNPEAFTLLFSNQGGCVSAFNASPNSATFPAHFCQALRRDNPALLEQVYGNQGACVNALKAALP